MTKPRDGVDLDAILVELGHCGRYQLRNYCLILVPVMLSAVFNGQYVFAAGDIPYRCLVPECESSPPEFEAGAWGAWALPAGAVEGGVGGRCSRLAPLPHTNSCSADAFSSATQPCTAFIYQNDNTIVAAFELACQEWKRTLVGSLHSAGLFTALLFTGYISDKFGRRTAFILTASSRSLVGLVRAFSTNYIMYVVLEFLDATVGSGVYSTGFILALEMMSLKRRVLAGNIMSSTYAVGQVVLALVAWCLPHWRVLTLVLYTPTALFLLYYFVLQESVRWLLINNRKEEAANILFKAAEINKITLSAKAVEQLTSAAAPGAGTKRTHEYASPPPPPEATQRSLFSQVVHSRIMMSRLLICSMWWMTVTFIYYGLSINSVSLAGNKYINYMLTGLVEIPGYAISVLTLDRFGRKSPIMFALFICGIALIVLPFVDFTQQGLLITLNLVGKLSISMAFSSIYVYTLELFPTTGRHRVLAFCSMVGRVGQIIAPQTPLLKQYMEALPYLLFGGLAGAAGLLMLLTPETLHMKLPDTIEQAENIAVAPRTARRTDILVD